MAGANAAAGEDDAANKRTLDARANFMIVWLLVTAVR